MSDTENGGPVRTAKDFVARIDSDPWLADAITKDPIKVIKTILQPPLETDKWIYRIVVIALGLAVLMAIAGGIVVVLEDKQVPDVLVALGSAAVGALAGLLAPSPGKKSD